MNMLIIGGTGLISAAITRELLHRGDTVTHYNRGQSAAQGVAGVRTIIGDRTNYAMFERQMAQLGSWDCVMDMVGYKPEDATSVVRAFRDRTAQFIFCSTVDVYSKPAPRYPIRENAERQPRREFQYAFDKAITENTLLEAHERGSFPLTIIRPAYTYGEGRGMLSTFGGDTYLHRIRSGKPIVVHGDGTSLWVSCHRDDVAHAFVGAAGNRRAFGKAYNVTGEEWMTWNQYHQTVAAAIGAPAPTLVHIPTDLLREAVPQRAWITAENFQFNNIFDTGAARTDIDFRYTIPLATGVQRIVAWLDERQRIPNSDLDDVDDRLIVAWQRASARIVEELASASGAAT